MRLRALFVAGAVLALTGLWSMSASAADQIYWNWAMFSGSTITAGISFADLGGSGGGALSTGGHPLGVAIDPDQAWFWTPEWQAKEREADADTAAGRVERFESDEAFMAALDERGL